MSAEQIYFWWMVWLVIGVVIVIAAAALLITIIVLAHKIANLSQTAIGVVEDIERNTKPIWQLNATNQVAGKLLGGAKAILGNAGAIANALTDADRSRVA